ncbi:uncharacterized protein LOC122048572 [Zingiber officinale]|uniref:uncharacterized protein LOC122048572 n=1 Tax=Zingiber officinale TaxID=94328 RepID=UPI001C4B9801|nr:uncharacterized protein LOC122048572 [Zingiber officinale]
MSSSLLLLLSLFFPSSLSAVVTAQSSVLPSNSSTVYDILQEYNLPPSILPDTVKSFSVASNGYFVIDLYRECYVDFKYVVYYALRVSGFLGYGSVSNLEGVQIRSYLIWYGVSYIKVDLPYSDFVYIQGNLSLFQRAKKVVRSAFENKKERKKVHEVDILKKDPETIREQIEKLERMSILIVLFFLD